MTVDLLMVRTAAGLAPASQHDEELLSAFPRDAQVMVTARRPRNPRHHRLLWALLNTVQPSSSYETPDALLQALKLALGHYDILKLPNGVTVPIPKSISFAAMDQAKFRGFFDGAVRLICQHILPGMTDDELRQQVFEMLGDRAMEHA